MWCGPLGSLFPAGPASQAPKVQQMTQREGTAFSGPPRSAALRILDPGPGGQQLVGVKPEKRRPWRSAGVEGSSVPQRSLGVRKARWASEGAARALAAHSPIGQYLEQPPSVIGQYRPRARLQPAPREAAAGLRALLPRLGGRVGRGRRTAGFRDSAHPVSAFSPPARSI